MLINQSIHIIIIGLPPAAQTDVCLCVDKNWLQIEPRFVGGRHKCRRQQRIGSQAARCCVHRVTSGQTTPCGQLLLLLTELSGTIPPPPPHASAGRRPASLGHGMAHVGRHIQVPTWHPGHDPGERRPQPGGKPHKGNEHVGRHIQVPTWHPGHDPGERRPQPEGSHIRASSTGPLTCGLIGREIRCCIHHIEQNRACNP